MVYDRRIYAPFTKVVIEPVNKTLEKLSPLFLEEQSKIAIKDIYVGKDFDRRKVCSEIEIECLDPDADFENEAQYLKIMNQRAYVHFYGQGGGGFTDGPFRYTIGHEHLEGRGMRFVHRFTGRTRWIPWVSFEDTSGAWQQFLEAAGIS